MATFSTTAVVLPLHKPLESLDAAEKISLQQLFKVLHRHDIYLVTHSGIDIDAYKKEYGKNLRIKQLLFDKSYFQNIEGYNRLLLSIEFYDSFKAYTYILVTQLDVFIFSDGLNHFTSLGYDYIGAPWFEGYGLATPESQIIGGGNGGFSLRKVSSFITVLNITSLLRKPYISFAGFKGALLHLGSFLHILTYRFNKATDLNIPVFPWQYLNNEDLYWTVQVKQFFPWFKVGSITDATAFAFEVNPRTLYKLNNNQLPMAVHAWQKYDLDFWKPFIEERGYKIEGS